MQLSVKSLTFIFNFYLYLRGFTYIPICYIDLVVYRLYIPYDRWVLTRKIEKNNCIDVRGIIQSPKVF